MCSMYSNIAFRLLSQPLLALSATNMAVNRAGAGVGGVVYDGPYCKQTSSTDYPQGPLDVARGFNMNDFKEVRSRRA